MTTFLQKIGRMDSLPMKRRKKIIWKARSLFKIKDHPFETEFFGMKYHGHTENLIDKYVYYFGAYEKGMLKFIADTLGTKKDSVFVDVGANVGHHSFFGATIAKEVYSFEPYAKVRAQLENKLQINNIKNVKVIPFALGEEDQELTYFEPSNHNTGTGSFIKDFLPENQNTGLKLQVKNGDKLFDNLGIKNVGVIKIDTEGFEPLVLSGLLPFLRSQKPTIVMEFSDGSKNLFDSKPELVNFLKSEYDMNIFMDPNELNYKLVPWNFEKFGNIVLTKKKTT